jgi:hypothetical protein
VLLYHSLSFDMSEPYLNMSFWGMCSAFLFWYLGCIWHLLLNLSFEICI